MESITYSITRDDMLNGSAQGAVPFSTPLARAIKRGSGYLAAIPVDEPGWDVIYRFTRHPGRAAARATLPGAVTEFMREYDRVCRENRMTYPAPVSFTLEWEDIPESAYDLSRIQPDA